jgi:hypothetical protein
MDWLVIGSDIAELNIESGLLGFWTLPIVRHFKEYDVSATGSVYVLG